MTRHRSLATLALAVLGMLLLPATAGAAIDVGLESVAHTEERVRTGDVAPSVLVLYNDGTTGASTRIVLEGNGMRPLGVRATYSSKNQSNVDVSCSGSTTLVCDRYVSARSATVLVVSWGVVRDGRYWNRVTTRTTGDVRAANNVVGWRYGDGTGPDCTVLGTNGFLGGPRAAETVTGTAGDDVICGFGGRLTCNFYEHGSRCFDFDGDVVKGGGGNDLLLVPAVGARGDTVLPSDRYDGEAGSDTVKNIDRACPLAVVDLAGGSMRHECTRHDAGFETSHRLVSIENYTGGPNADRIFGTGGRNVLQGGAGIDMIDGRGGNDRLAGQSGPADLLSFGSSPGPVDVDLPLLRATGHGTDKISGFERVAGSSHDDTFRGTNARDLFIATPGDDTYDGRGHRDAVVYRSFAKGFFNLGTGAAAVDGHRQSLANIETIIGTRGNDTLVGSAGVDALNGWSGNDRIEGRGGNDVLLGYAGNDILLGGGGSDKLFGQAGRDACRQYPASTPYVC